MAKDMTATIHLKTTPALRNRISGKLRMRGVTMQSFFVDLMELIDKDESLLELLEHKREALNVQRNHEPPQATKTRAGRPATPRA